MRVSLVNALAKHLNVDRSEASDMVDAFARDIQRTVEADGQARINGLGVFYRENGAITFEPDSALVEAVNLDTDSLEPVLLAGAGERVDERGERIEEGEEESVESGERGEVEEPEGLDEAAAMGAPEEVAEVGEAEEVAEPEELFEAAAEDDSAAASESEDVVLEDAGDEEESDLIADDLSEEEYFEESPDAGFWEGPEGNTHLGYPRTSDFEEADFSVLPDSSGQEKSFASRPPDEAEPVPEIEPLPDYEAKREAESAPESAPEPQPHRPAASHGHPGRGDRPPEQHAEVREVRQPERRRSTLPMVLLAVIMLLAVGVAAYYILIREDEPILAATEEQTDEAEGASPGAGDEAVPDAPEEPAQEPPEARFDVSEGGWTVVVGSATSLEEATEIAETFREEGYDAVVLHGSVGGITRYRIVIDQFETENEAVAYLRDAPQGFPADAWRLPVTSNLELVH